jgi:cytochrome c
MSKLFSNYLFLCIIFLFSGIAAASTPDQAKALVEEAVGFYKANGKDKSFAAFGDPKSKFTHNDLYIFVFDNKGTLVAHGANQKLVGKNLLDSQDPNGKYFAQDFMKVGKEGGWVDYIWPNPETRKLQAKSSYIIQIDDFRFGCGIYK